MSRVGQVFMGRLAAPWVALVTEGPSLPRREGSAARGHEPLPAPDRLVHTLCVWGGSGVVRWPVERTEDTLARWELEGRRVA